MSGSTKDQIVYKALFYPFKSTFLTKKRNLVSLIEIEFMCTCTIQNQTFSQTTLFIISTLVKRYLIQK